MQLSIVIPAHNEEKRIGDTLDGYARFYSKQTEIIVVLNACHDNTLGVVREKQSKHSFIKYIDIAEAIGKGGAIREGFKIAEGEIIGFVDADMATSPEEFEKLIAAVKNNDGAIASRYAPGASIKRTWGRKIISIGFRITQKMLFNLPYYDTQCGAKVFKKEVIKKILPKMKINNMIIDVEILSLAKKYGYKIEEVPTIWEEKDSSSFLGSPYKIFKNSIILFFNLIKLRIRI